MWAGAEIGGDGQTQYAPQDVAQQTDGSVEIVDDMAGKMCRIGHVVFTGFAETRSGFVDHIIAVARITLEETGGWVATEKTCSTRIDVDFPDLITEIPDAFLKSMAVTHDR